MPQVLTIEQSIATLHRRYPGALLCTGCGVLMATQPASYASSNLTEAQRLAYACAECRHDAAAAAQHALSRGLAARLNLAQARAAKAERRASRDGLRGPESSPTISATSHTVFRHGRAGQAGRPLVSKIEQKRKAREPQRAYSQRQGASVAA